MDCLKYERKFNYLFIDKLCRHSVPLELTLNVFPGNKLHNEFYNNQTFKQFLVVNKNM